MSASGSSNKRDGDPHEGPPAKRSLRSAAGLQPAKSLEPLLPYDLPEQVNAVLPSEIFGLRGFSQAEYAQDVFFIFAATPTQHNIREMHEVWLKCRRPTIDELWASRHPAGTFARTVAKKILRKILTLEELLQQASESQLVQKAQMLLLDHLMLMCVEYTGDYYTLYFPDYEARFYELAGILRTTEPSEPSKSASTPSGNTTSTIAPEVRARIEGLRVEPASVTPLKLISGNTKGKEMIKRAIFISTRVPHLASEGLGTHGILLHGPPGTGKTLLAMASAAQSEKCKVYNVPSSDLIKMWHGTSEQTVAAPFQIAAENAPAVIVIDEVEGLCHSRQSSSGSGADDSMHGVANAFLACITKYKGVIVIGTTNLPWKLSSAFGRRFRTKVHVYLPSDKACEEIIRHRLSKFNHSLNDAEMASFARDCRGFTGDSVVQTINATAEELVGEFESATHFRPVKIGGRRMYCPCKSDAPGAVKRTYEDFEQEGSTDTVTTRKLDIGMLRYNARTSNPKSEHLKLLTRSIEHGQTTSDCNLSQSNQALLSDSSDETG